MRRAIRFWRWSLVQPVTAALAVLVMIGAAQARPVSYPGGWTFIGETNGFMNAGLLHYSPSARYSLGLRVERRRLDEMVFAGLQATRLVKRWNREDAQANLYVSGGVGASIGDFGGQDTRAQGAGFVGLSADWETRRLFAAYSVRHLVSGGVTDQLRQMARAGFAPYEGDYGDVHTWLMVQVDHRPRAPSNTVVATPFVRVFKGPTLVEVGYGTDDRVLLNVIHRF